MQSFTNQSIYVKGERRDLTDQRLTEIDESNECPKFIWVWLAKDSSWTKLHPFFLLVFSYGAKG